MIVLTMYSRLVEILHRLAANTTDVDVPATGAANAALWMVMQDGGSGV